MPRTSAGKASTFSLRVVEEIEKARKDAGIPQAELYEGAEMSSNYFYSRLRGELPFNTNDIEKLAAVMELDPIIVLQRAARPNLSVVPPLDDDHLRTVHLDPSRLAATTDDSPVYPDRGEE